MNPDLLSLVEKLINVLNLAQRNCFVLLEAEESNTGIVVKAEHIKTGEVKIFTIEMNERGIAASPETDGDFQTEEEFAAWSRDNLG